MDPDRSRDYIRLPVVVWYVNRPSRFRKSQTTFMPNEDLLY
jgi:hypothetical protein